MGSNEQRPKAVILSIAVTSEELSAIQRNADTAGMLVTTYLRHRALETSQAVTNLNLAVAAATDAAVKRLKELEAQRAATAVEYHGPR